MPSLPQLHIRQQSQVYTIVSEPSGQVRIGQQWEENWFSLWKSLAVKREGIWREEGRKRMKKETQQDGNR